MYDAGNDPTSPLKTDSMIICVPTTITSLSKIKIDLFSRMESIPRSEGFYVLEMKGKATCGCDRYEGYVSPSLGLASVLSDTHIPPDLYIKVPQQFSRRVGESEPSPVLIIRFSRVISHLHGVGLCIADGR